MAHDDTLSLAHRDLAHALRQCRPRWVGLATRLVGDRALADDLVQEATLRAWTQRDRYDPSRASVSTWVGAIVRALVQDHFTELAREAAHAEAEPFEPAPPPIAPDEALDAARWEAVLDALPPLDAELLRRRAVADEDWTEVVSALGLRDRFAAKRAYAAALDRLRAKLIRRGLVSPTSISRTECRAAA